MLIGLVVGRSAPVLWAIGLAAATYIGSLYLRSGSFDAWSPLVALAFLASSELAYWSIDSRVRSLDELQVHMRRAQAILIVLGVALLLAAIVAGAGAVGTASIAVTAAATIAFLVTLGGLAALTWRGRVAADTNAAGRG